MLGSEKIININIYIKNEVCVEVQKKFEKKKMPTHRYHDHHHHILSPSSVLHDAILLLEVPELLCVDEIHDQLALGQQKATLAPPSGGWVIRRQGEGKVIGWRGIGSSDRVAGSRAVGYCGRGSQRGYGRGDTVR